MEKSTKTKSIQSKVIIFAVLALIAIIIMGLSLQAASKRTSTRSKASMPLEVSTPIKVKGMVEKVDPCTDEFCFRIIEDKTLKSYYLKESPKLIAESSKKVKQILARYADKMSYVVGTLLAQPVEYILIDKITFYEKPPCQPRPKCLDDAVKPCKIAEPAGGWCAESASSVCKDIGLKSLTPLSPCDNNIGYHRGNYVCNDDFTGTIESQDGEVCFSAQQLNKLGIDGCQKYSSCKLTPTPVSSSDIP